MVQVLIVRKITITQRTNVINYDEPNNFESEPNAIHTKNLSHPF